MSRSELVNQQENEPGRLFSSYPINQQEIKSRIGSSLVPIDQHEVEPEASYSLNTINFIGNFTRDTSSACPINNKKLIENIVNHRPYKLSGN